MHALFDGVEVAVELVPRLLGDITGATDIGWFSVAASGSLKHGSDGLVNPAGTDIRDPFVQDTN